MRRTLTVLGLAVSVLALTTSSVFAGNAHIVGTPKVTVVGNSIVISAKVAGLGNVDFANLSLTGELQVSARCYTRSGNTPQAANKQETTSVSQSGTFPVRNGSTTASFTIAPASTLNCPGGQRVVIESASGTLTLRGEDGSAIGTIEVSYP